MEELCEVLHNWFQTGCTLGQFEISGGTLSLPSLQTGQYFRIVGSVFNDGVYTYPAQGLTDETFDGAVWAMAVPNAVKQLAEDIEDWKETHGTLESPYSSESFGGYSYTVSQDGDAGASTGWQKAFRSRINRWKKVG